MKNDGKAIERMLEQINGGYLALGEAKIEKVDPPVRVFNGRTIFMQNPFLDYTGTWRKDPDKPALPIHFEVKKLAENRMRIAAPSGAGISEKQFGNLDSWRNYGAVVFVLWYKDNAFRLLTFPMLRDALHRGEKSIKWDDAIGTDKGVGWIFWDYLKTVRLAMRRGLL